MLKCVCHAERSEAFERLLAALRATWARLICKSIFSSKKLKGVVSVKAKRTNLLFIFIIAAAFLSLSIVNPFVSADVTVPETIKVGLSYGGSGADLFTLTSESGIRVGINTSGSFKELFQDTETAGFKIRKDAYYNIVSGKEIPINYVKAAKYEGEVIGPYHIQFGDTYPDIESAKKMAEQMRSVAPDVFLAYEDGWRVWSQLYLEESECINQIQLMKNEVQNVKYSVVYPDKRRIQLLDGTTGQLLYILNGDEGVVLAPADSNGKTGTLQYKGKKYRGRITLQRLEKSDITVINELPLDQYLYSVVPSEMPSDWPLEALKAQAVAARNFTIITMGRHTDYGFDLCATEHCQAYSGADQENERSSKAVDATAGKLLLYNGQLASTYYHSSSGGHTENIEDIWSGTLPYIRGVEDGFSLGSPYDNWILQLKGAEMREKLKESDIDVGDILDVRPIETSKFGRVTKVEVKGTKGTQTFEKEKLRYILGTRSLKSIWYKLKTDADIYVANSLAGSPLLSKTTGMTILSASGTSKANSPSNRIFVKGMRDSCSYSIIPDIYTFEGKGFGHGLGMSQYGAKGMAEQGYNYIKILEYYYQGAKVQ